MKWLSFYLSALLLATTHASTEDSLGLEHTLLPRQGATSPCILSCYTQIFPTFNCPNVTECICYNVPLQNALTACTLANDCSIADAIAAEKTQKELCGAPIRNRSMTFMVVETVFLVLAAIAATMRAFGRGTWFGGAGYGRDDLILFLCCIPMIGLSVTGYLETVYGLGQDIWELPLPEIERVLMFFYIGNTFYSPVIFGTKIAMVLLYIRVWKDSDLLFRRICQGVIVLLLMAMIAFEFSTIFLCDPIQYAWKAVAGLPGHCIQRNAQLYTNSAFNIAADFVVLLLPVPKIISLRMDTAKKAGLMFTFLIGFAVTAASITQFYYLITKVSNTQNPTWDFFDIAIWRVTEMYLSVICCCAPIIAGLWKRSWRKAASAVSSRLSQSHDKSWASSSAQHKSNLGGSVLASDENRRTKRTPAEWVELRSNEDGDRKELNTAKELEEGSDPSDSAVEAGGLTWTMKRDTFDGGVDNEPPPKDLEARFEPSRKPALPRVQSARKTVHPLRSQGKSIPSDESMNGTKKMDAFREPVNNSEALPGGMARSSSRSSRPSPLKNLRTTATRLSPTSSPTEEYFTLQSEQDIRQVPVHPKLRSLANSSRAPPSPYSYQSGTPRHLPASPGNERGWRSSQSDYSSRPLPATPEVWTPVDHQSQRDG